MKLTLNYQKILESKTIHQQSLLKVHTVKEVLFKPPYRYTNADSKITLYILIHIKILP